MLLFYLVDRDFTTDHGVLSQWSFIDVCTRRFALLLVSLPTSPHVAMLSLQLFFRFICSQFPSSSIPGSLRPSFVFLLCAGGFDGAAALSASLERVESATGLLEVEHLFFNFEDDFIKTSHAKQISFSIVHCTV